MTPSDQQDLKHLTRLRDLLVEIRGADDTEKLDDLIQRLTDQLQEYSE